jgi:hypothetical protein
MRYDIERGDERGGYFIDEALTRAVTAICWRQGLAAPFDACAAVGQVRIELPRTAIALAPATGTALRVVAVDDGERLPLVTAQVSGLEVKAGEPRAALLAEDAIGQLARSQARLPFLTDAGAGAAIAAVLDAVGFRSTYLAAAWRLGSSPLGAGSRLAPTGPERIIAGGRTRFDLLGPALGTVHGTVHDDARDLIAGLAAAEGGRFFADRLGRLVFLDRHEVLRQHAASQIVAAGPAAIDTASGGGLATQVQITITPQHIGAPGATLWSMATTLRLESGAERRLLVRFVDENGAPAAALAIQPPVPLVDYRANSQANGLGADVTAAVSVSVQALQGDQATLVWRNDGATPAWVQPGARLRGTPIVQETPVTAVAEAQDARTDYGDHPLALTLPHLNRLEDAERLARVMLARRRDPAPRPRTLSLCRHTQPALVLALDLFDTITLAGEGVGGAGAYQIVAADHTIGQGGYRHCVTYTLEPAAGPYWTLGQGRLGRESTLAY